jgi:hypothetical protein
MRDQVSEPRAAQNDTRGGSSETDVSELTIDPAGLPSGAAVTNATPVANLPSASRNERASGAAATRPRHLSGAGPLRRERRGRGGRRRGSRRRVHEGAGLNVAVGARKRAAVDVAGTARAGEGAIHDPRGRARQDAARGSEVDGVAGHVHARARIALDAPDDAAAGDRVGRLGDAERGRGVEQPGDQVRSI